MRTLYSLATGITRSRKYVMRSQNTSASTCPARVSGGFGMGFLRASRCCTMASPRPGVRPVRSTPRMLMLYLMDGMPAAAQFLIMVCSASISRSRSGLCASMMAGCFSRSMWLDARNGGAMQSMLMPYLPAMSTMRLSSSTVAYRRSPSISG